MFKPNFKKMCISSSNNTWPPKDNLKQLVGRCWIDCHFKNISGRNADDTKTFNNSVCENEAKWIIEKLLATNNDKFHTKIEAYQKKGWNEKEETCIFSILSRKAGLDLLWVVEKLLATRGLGVPVDKRIGKEFKPQTITLSPCLFSRCL